jgi:hypothetical protein
MPTTGRQTQLQRLEARAAVLEQEILALTTRLKLGKQSAARRPQHVQSAADFLASADADSANSAGGLLDFVISQARDSASDPAERARIEELIAGTVSTSANMRAATKKAREGHEALVAEFGEDAVARWKEEHGEMVKSELGFPGFTGW